MGKYNISKTSRTVNISNELLRHYERLGLIEPDRGEERCEVIDASRGGGLCAAPFSHAC